MPPATTNVQQQHEPTAVDIDNELALQPTTTAATNKHIRRGGYNKRALQQQPASTADILTAAVQRLQRGSRRRSGCQRGQQQRLRLLRQLVR